MPKIPTDAQRRLSPHFQKRLKELISDEDCTKYQFAARVGVSRDVISRATVYGIIPSLKSLIKIADYLNVSLEYLLCDTNQEIFYKADPPTTIHARLNELKGDKLKYSTIGHKMPFSENLFYEWIREGTLPSLEYLTALAEYFDVSIDYLLGRTDDKKN